MKAFIKRSKKDNSWVVIGLYDNRTWEIVHCDNSYHYSKEILEKAKLGEYDTIEPYCEWELNGAKWLRFFDRGEIDDYLKLTS